MAQSVAEQVFIDHVGHRGDGVAEFKGRQVFVPNALPGETIEIAPDAKPDRARLARIIAASPERIQPICPYFGACGGCAIQHWQDAPYRNWKRNLVVEALAQAGIACEVAGLVDAHGEGRRRITLHASQADGVLKIGFTASGSHTIIAIDHCPILVQSLDGAMQAAHAIAESLLPAKKPLDIQFTATQTGLDVDIRGSGPLSAAMTGALAAIAGRYRLARLTRHGELIVQRSAPVIAIGPAQLTLPPGSFLQATEAGEIMLADLVLQLTGKVRLVADLFCGVGPFALRLAQKSKVLAFDSEAGAIDALRKAAKATKGLKPVTAEIRDLFRRPLLPHELNDADAVVFDPPRQGAMAQVVQIAASKVPLVISVSCNVQTFARDARILIDAGYRIGEVTPVDQFRHTPHVELVARFER